uniref:Uncharacterized protein n=1 Tax=Helicotheca tamesis TaxID=374047 RepID=A0A7S2E2L5_9STRA
MILPLPPQLTKKKINPQKRYVYVAMPSRTASLRSLFSSSRESPSHKHDIVRLIEKRKWKKLRQLLHQPNNDASPPTAAEVLSSFPEDALQQTALHFLCTRNPPLDIVQSFIEVVPQYTFELDIQDQTPLHTATSFGANLDVIEYLIYIHPEAASAKDVDGKTPLILACESIETLDCDEFIYSMPKGWSEELIAILVNSSPRTVADEDIAGMSALEYAISNHASSKIVRFLQNACRQEGLRKQRDQQREASRMARRASELQRTVQTSPLSSASFCGIESISAQSIVCGVPFVVFTTQGNEWTRRISALTF